MGTVEELRTGTNDRTLLCTSVELAAADWYSPGEFISYCCIYFFLFVPRFQLW
jgi:hypothetical protein